LAFLFWLNGREPAVLTPPTIPQQTCRSRQTIFICYHDVMYGLGFIATVIGIIGGIPYILNTLKKKTKPHRFAWLIFLILSIIAFASQFALGARASLIFYGWFVINNVILFSLSMRKNGGYGDINTVNIICFVLAMVAVVLWKTTDSALLALICVLIADGIGAILIVVKAYKHPHTETMAMWAMGSVATLLNILAVGSTEVSLLAAPTQVFLFNVAIVVAILLGKRLRANHS
jgi:hypothetical protein